MIGRVRDVYRRQRRLIKPHAGEWGRLEDDARRTVMTWHAAGFAFGTVTMLFNLLLDPPTWVLMLTALPIALLLTALSATAAWRLVHRHRVRLAQLARRRQRIKLGAPRLGPVTESDCTECHRPAGSRHQTWCPRIPVGWFNARTIHPR